MKKLLFISLFAFSISSFAATNSTSQNFSASSSMECGEAVATTESNFCGSFEQVAPCQCKEHGGTSKMCASMDKIYKNMIDIFGNLKSACKRHSNPQLCEDDWNCYNDGGTNHEGGLCSGTGNSCKKLLN